MIECIPIADITIGERRRQELRNIDALAKSIDQHGLLHPIILSADNELIAGERRLRAYQKLGLTEIEAQRWAGLSDAQRHEIELAENVEREDLTAYERSRVMVELAEVAAEVDRSEVEKNPTEFRKGLRGPASVPGSEKRVAQRLGIPQPTLNDAKHHKETADTYPALQKPDWKQYHVLEAKERLEALSEPERVEAVKLIDQPGIPPKDAIGILSNLSAMEPEERGEVFRLAESTDSRDRDRALTTAARRPPMPDPRSTVLSRVVLDLKKAARMFPADPFAPQIESLIPAVRAVIADLDDAYQESKDADTVPRKVS